MRSSRGSLSPSEPRYSSSRAEHEASNRITRWIDAIPGIFAGYEITTGLGWSNKYLVWAIEDFVEQNLAYDADRPIMKLLTPHVTEKIEIVGGSRGAE